MTKEAVTATIWTRTNCPACTKAKRLLDSKQIPWVEKKLNSDANKRQFALQTKGARSVPQIFIGGVHIEDILPAKEPLEEISLLASSS